MKQFKKLSLHRPIIKELSDQQNPGNYNFVICKSNFLFRKKNIFFRFSYF